MGKKCTSPTYTQAGGDKGIEYYRLKTATLAEDGQKVFLATILAFDSGKAVMQIAAVQIHD